MIEDYCRFRDSLIAYKWRHSDAKIKQLSRGTFEFPVPSDPDSPMAQIRASELSMLLDGIELKGRKRRPRYERSS